MKLVLYSGGFPRENLLLDRALFKMVKNKSPLFSFIPSQSYESELDFVAYVKRYQRFGVGRFLHFPIDIPTDEALLDEVFRSDVIHLGGGNTFYFLKHLRKQGILSKLRTFVKNGGILTGLSAGAIMMTPSITTASFPTFDCDDNDENLKNLKALNLVSFEFFPHYKHTSRYIEEMKRYSLKIAVPLYACPDGSGIVVNEERVQFVGKVYSFERGNLYKTFL